MAYDDKAKNYFKQSDVSGKGGYGQVFFAQQIVPTKMNVAIKRLPHVTDKQKFANAREVGFLNLCAHPNIVKHLRTYVFSDQIWIVMEFMLGGTLRQAVKAHTFKEPQIAYVAREVLKALEFLHHRKFVHRDLKSSNIMLTCDGRIKLIDFGLCADVSNGLNKFGMVGSPFWLAPEMIQGKTHCSPADIWGFGICLLEMANKSAPNEDSRMRAMYLTATKGAPLPNPQLWSGEFNHFLMDCLKMDPNERATAEQLLEHPFIRKADSRKSMEKIIAGVFIHNTLVLSGVI